MSDHPPAYPWWENERQVVEASGGTHAYLEGQERIAEPARQISVVPVEQLYPQQHDAYVAMSLQRVAADGQPAHAHPNLPTVPSLHFLESETKDSAVDRSTSSCLNLNDLVGIEHLVYAQGFQDLGFFEFPDQSRHNSDATPTLKQAARDFLETRRGQGPAQATASWPMMSSRPSSQEQGEQGGHGDTVGEELPIKLYRVHLFSSREFEPGVLEDEQSRLSFSWAKEHPVYGDLCGPWSSSFAETVADGARRAGSGYMLLVKKARSLGTEQLDNEAGV